MTKHEKFVMPAILLVGLGLRLIGLNVGLPKSPDPREVLIAQDVLNLMHFTAPPEIYNWPGTAWFYLIAGIGKLFSIGKSLLPEDVILLARFVNVLLSTATLWFTYRLGASCYNRRVGQIAAGFLAVAMLHATNESRFALVDIPATFCVTLFLWILMRGRACKARRQVPHLIWLGIAAGIGFSVKFTTVFAGLTALGFIGTARLRMQQILTIVGVATLTFTLLCPYWLIDLVSPEWNLFFEDFWYEATHYQRGHFGLFATAETGGLARFVYLWTLLKWGMGWPLALLALFGVMHALVVRRRVELALLAFVIPYLLFIGAHKVKFTRHLLILYPVLMVFASAMLARFPSAPSSLGEILMRLKSTPLGRVFACLLGGVVALYSLVYTAAFASVLLTQPTRDEVSAWVSANVLDEENISCAPEILFDWLLPELAWELTHDEDAAWALILLPNAEVFQKDRKARSQGASINRTMDWYPLEEVALAETFAFYERVQARYELQKIFRRNPRFLGIRISDEGAPFPMRALVHPEIRLYRRRE